MMIHEITAKVGRAKSRRRIGRGEGSGRGGTSGRGHKGAKSRSGWSSKKGYEGGQNPMIRRMPKRGFSNFEFANEFVVVNVADLEKFFNAGAEVDATSLAATGAIRNNRTPLKVLGEGSLSKKLTVKAAKFSAMAKKKIEDAGGSVVEEPPMKWSRKGTVSKINPKPTKRLDPKVAAYEAKLAKAKDKDIEKEKGKAKGEAKTGEGKGKKDKGAEGSAPKKEGKPKSAPQPEAQADSSEPATE
jgi:large subunit ribosomal protein L15